MCFRRYLRFLRGSRNDPNAAMRCPLWRAHVHPEVVPTLIHSNQRAQEPVLLLHPALVPLERQESVPPDRIQCAGSKGMEYLTEPMRVRDLPEDPNCSGQGLKSKSPPENTLKSAGTERSQRSPSESGCGYVYFPSGSRRKYGRKYGTACPGIAFGRGGRRGTSSFVAAPAT